MYGVSRITTANDIMLIGYHDAPAARLPEVLGQLAEAGVVVDMISQTAAQGAHISFSFTAPYESFDTVIATLKGSEGSPMISGGYSKLYLFGEDMVESVGVAARALQAATSTGTDIAMITTSDLDISLLVRQEDEDVCLAALHEAFEV